MKIEEVKQLLKSASEESLNMSLQDVHYPGMFSLVIAGTEPGRLTRVFIAKRKLRFGDVQYHSHRYPLTITPLTNGIVNHVLKDDVHSNLHTYEYEYVSPLNGGTGLSSKATKVAVQVNNIDMCPGMELYMRSFDVHTMSCKKGAMWVVEEHGFQANSSKVYGVPFVLDGLYNPPSQFQVNDMFQLCSRQVDKLLAV